MKSKKGISNEVLAGAVGVAAVAVGAAVVASRNQTKSALNAPPFEPILNPMLVRQDRGGDGHFGSGRIGHIHEGTDFSCTPNQPIYAPFDGKIVRTAQPYPDDPNWKGMLIRSITDDYECKLFYCILAEPVGFSFLRGQLIGFCQAISHKYTSGVTDHLHVEVRKSGSLMNPETLWRLSPGPVV